MEPPRRHDQWLRRALRHLGVDAANAMGRTVARRRPAAHRRLLLRRPECVVAHAEDPEPYVGECRGKVLADAVAYLDNHVGLYLPGAVTEQGFAWQLLVGVNGHRGAAALETQHVSVNIDPSDRYVQSVPGSDRYRLRSDESGYDNLVLAGDWTDSGMNAGCIEAAVMSGLQAANALLGRGHRHRIRGFYMP